MSFGIGIGDVITVIDKGMLIYDKIKNRKEPIIEITNHMTSLQRYLKPLREFLEERNGLARLLPEQRATLKTIMSEVQVDVEKVNVILDEWEKNIGPGGLAWRFPKVGQTWFALSGNPDELAKLGASLSRREDEINHHLTMMLGFGVGAIVAQGNSPNNQAPVQQIQNVVSILFIDSMNESRSVVSMVYAQLLREWTIRKNTSWRIAQMHSAGLVVKSLSQIADIQESLNLHMSHGEIPPNEVALAALFAKETSMSPQQQKIKESVYQRKSRGLDRAMFTRYDYLIFFNHSDIATVERLREAMRARKIQTVQQGKGKTILLGEYGPSKYSEIWEPRTNDRTNPQYRADWDKTVWNIKASFRGFLKQELGWNEPSWHAGPN